MTSTVHHTCRVEPERSLSPVACAMGTFGCNIEHIGMAAGSPVLTRFTTEDAIMRGEGEPFAKLRMRPGDQQLPKANQHPVIQELVMGDMKARMELGLSRYGTLLQPHNGRDMLLDAYQEAMDLCIYLRGAMYERDGK